MSDIKIPIAEPDLKGNELKYAMNCLSSGWISSRGEYIEKFEQAMAEFCSANHVISTSNGTTALHLALLAVGIEPGDEVIVPNMTFAATAAAVRHAHAIPILADVRLEDGNIDPRSIEKKISPKTRAIIPVHLYGQPCDMGSVMEIAHKHDLRVIEDCAEALGAKYEGRAVGTIGDVGCFSFFGNKIITTGEGGMCTTEDPQLAVRMELLKNHGMEPSRRYWHPVVGFNYRMTNIQAAIGLAQAERLPTFLSARDNLAQHYRDQLRGLEGVTPFPSNPTASSVCWLFSILVEEQLSSSRDEIIKQLSCAGIESRGFFAPLNTMPPYASEEQFPNSRNLSQRGICLPSSVNVTEGNVNQIVEAIACAIAKH